jgi:hypothetical protein
METVATHGHLTSRNHKRTIAWQGKQRPKIQINALAVATAHGGYLGIGTWQQATNPWALPLTPVA